jgi:hypothetical protein
MIAATLHGPSYDSINYDFDSIEVFASLEEVIEALFERYSSNGQFTCEAAYLDGHTDSTYYPAFDPGTYFTCYRIADIEDDTDLEGQRLEAHTAVHGGWRDYTVTLVQSEEGALSVTVEKAGI